MLPMIIGEGEGEGGYMASPRYKMICTVVNMCRGGVSSTIEVEGRYWGNIGPKYETSS